jgi:hypothetical protein
MTHAAALRRILAASTERMRILGLAASLGLPDCWIAAGFVRSAVWDHLHNRPPASTWPDIDVIWFGPDRADPALDAAIEHHLRGLEPAQNWSVKNQARMHTRNGHPPYASATDAMRYWPETASAVAARLAPPLEAPMESPLESRLEIAAPLGLDDLFGLILAPGPAAPRATFGARAEDKKWRDIWPLLRTPAGA